MVRMKATTAPKEKWTEPTPTLALSKAMVRLMTASRNENALSASGTQVTIRTTLTSRAMRLCSNGRCRCTRASEASGRICRPKKTSPSRIRAAA